MIVHRDSIVRRHDGGMSRAQSVQREIQLQHIHHRLAQESELAALRVLRDQGANNVRRKTACFGHA
jgi:hypothetical protein